MLRQTHDVEHLRRPPAHGTRRHVVERGLDLDRLASREEIAAGLEGLLHHVADTAAHRVRVLRHVEAADTCRPGGRTKQRGEHPDGGGLPRTVRAEQPEHLAAIHSEVEALDGRGRTEGAGERGGVHEGRHPGRPACRYLAPVWTATARGRDQARANSDVRRAARRGANARIEPGAPRRGTGRAVTVYAESSSVLRWLFDEAHADEIHRLLCDAAKVVCSRLTLVETRRVIRRAVAEGLLDEWAAWRSSRPSHAQRPGGPCSSCLATWRSARRGRFPSSRSGPSYALHLASALLLRQALPDLRLLSSDDRVRANGRRLGLEVLPA